MPELYGLSVSSWKAVMLKAVCMFLEPDAPLAYLY